MFLACVLAQIVALLSGGSGPPEGRLVVAPEWESHWRVTHYDPAGVACYDSTGPERRISWYLYFKQPVRMLARSDPFVRVADGTIECFVEADKVSQMHKTPVQCVEPAPVAPLVPLEGILKEGTPPPALVAPSTGRRPPSPAGEEGIDVGVFYPTFYQIALEQYYPLGEGEEGVELRDGEGEVIARVSRDFRRALLIQGTAALADGRVLNVGGHVRKERRYVLLPAGSSGLGINGFHLRPYRSAAVDFDLLCRRLEGHAGCDPDNVEKRDKGRTRSNRRILAGTLFHIPQLEGATMADGTVHDGYVCAVDVGGGIKEDRIDLFVGTDGAGNPYYPDCRRDNAFIRHGVESLIPSDWRHFKLEKDGSYSRSVQVEYRQNARHKGLRVYVVPGVACGKGGVRGEG